MSKLKLGVIFGGMSTEHDVSITSGTSVIKNLDKEKYEIFPIYIDKEGKWYQYTKRTEDIEVLEVGEEIAEEIRKTAIKAFKAADGSGLSRVDFFIENDTNRIIINEINTMPGFTQISMYPKLWEQMGLSYPKLLDRLIELAFVK